MVMEAAPRPHLFFGGDVREEKSRQLAAELRQTVLRNLGRAVDSDSNGRSYPTREEQLVSDTSSEHSRALAEQLRETALSRTAYRLARPRRW